MNRVKTTPFKPSGYWLLIGLLAIFLGSTVTVSNAAAQENSQEDQLTVVAPALNVRSGPGVAFEPLDVLLQGDQVTVVSYNAAADWWQVQLPNGTTGWVSGGAEYVSVSDSLMAQPETPQAQQAGSASTNEAIVLQTQSGGPIYIIDPATGQSRYLTTGLDPALSPDGQWVAFAQWETSQDGALGSLWVINIDGTDERVIMNNVLNPRTPVWSPDGMQIVISFQHGGRPQPVRTCGDERPPRDATDVSTRRDNGNIIFCYTKPPDPRWGLRMVNVATGAYEDLPHDTYSLSPAWDPANSWRLVYDGNEGLVNLDLNLGTTWALTTDIHDHSPVFSPDGSKIAVSYLQHDHWEVHVMNADGSERVRLTETPWTVIAEQTLAGQPVRQWNNAAPVWSPDGSRIAFLTDRTGQWELWVMNVDGSNPRPLLPENALANLNLQYAGVDEQLLSWR